MSRWLTASASGDGTFSTAGLIFRDGLLSSSFRLFRSVMAMIGKLALHTHIYR